MPAEDVTTDTTAEKPMSYSYRDHPETPGEVLWNRISVTATLFTTAIASALLLGKKR